MTVMNGPDRRREVLMLALVAVVAFVSPLFFDQSPLNWMSVLFFGLYVAQRGFHVAARRAAPVRG